MRRVAWLSAVAAVWAGCGGPADVDGGMDGAIPDAADASIADAGPASDGGADDVAVSDGGLDASAPLDAGVDAPLDGGLGPPTDAGPPPCAPVRHHTVVLGADRSLSCVPPGAPIEILRTSIADRGIAVARMHLVLRGTGAASAGVHGWGGDGDVGDPSFARRISWGAGEGLCPGETVDEVLIATGELTDVDHEVWFSVRQYRSTDCVEGTLVVDAASTLEVWVEDPAPHCRGRDIVAQSYFQTVWDTHGSGADRPVAMTTDPTPMIEASLVLDTAADVTVLAQTEINPSATSNVCGDRFETGFAVTTGTDGTSLVTRDTFAPSGGGAHVLIPVRLERSLAAGTHSFALAAGVDQAIRAGALAGATFSGDTLIVLVAQR